MKSHVATHILRQNHFLFMENKAVGALLLLLTVKQTFHKDFYANFFSVTFTDFHFLDFFFIISFFIFLLVILALFLYPTPDLSKKLLVYLDTFNPSSVNPTKWSNDNWWVTAAALQRVKRSGNVFLGLLSVDFYQSSPC